MDRGSERRTAANAIPSNNVHKSSAFLPHNYTTLSCEVRVKAIYIYISHIYIYTYSLPSLPPELGKDFSRFFQSMSWLEGNPARISPLGCGEVVFDDLSLRSRLFSFLAV